MDQKPFVAWFMQHHARLMALAIGDGVNDVGMIRASHVSVGIRGTESQLAADAASFRADEWKQLRPLLLQHAVRTMVLLSTTMKWIYYKHAMTACMLEAWMVHNRRAVRVQGSWERVKEGGRQLYECSSQFALVCVRFAFNFLGSAAMP